MIGDSSLLSVAPAANRGLCGLPGHGRPVHDSFHILHSRADPESEKVRPALHAGKLILHPKLLLSLRLRGLSAPDVLQAAPIDFAFLQLLPAVDSVLRLGGQEHGLYGPLCGCPDNSSALHDPGHGSRRSNGSKVLWAALQDERFGLYKCAARLKTRLIKKKQKSSSTAAAATNCNLFKTH